MNTHTIRITNIIVTIFLIVVANTSVAQTNIVQIGDGFGGIVGSGKKKAEDRTISAFDRIEIDGSPDLKIAVGKKQLVRVIADDNILPLIKTEVRGKRLFISTTGSYSSRIGLEIEISVPSFVELNSKGSSEIEIKDLRGEQFKLDVSGSGDIQMSGQVNRLVIVNEGSSDLDLTNLSINISELSLVGSGDAHIGPSKQLTIDLQGSGDVDYRGHPTLKKTITGSGEISQATE